jgi:hypothetical protein
MNIFFLDSDVTKCAQMHNDKHCVKMILEYSQLLSTAHRVLDGREEEGKKMVAGSFPVRWRKFKQWKLNDERDTILYSATHLNHPSAIWTRQSDSNYRWLHNLLVELCKEYTFRYGRVHKCESSGLVNALKQLPINISQLEFTEPTPAMPEEIKIINDSVASYRNYYIKSKQHLANWSGKVNSRSIPEWFSYA